MVEVMKEKERRGAFKYYTATLFMCFSTSTTTSVEIIVIPSSAIKFGPSASSRLTSTATRGTRPATQEVGAASD